MIAELKHRFYRERWKPVPEKPGIKKLVSDWKHPLDWPHWECLGHQTPDEESFWGAGVHIYFYRCKWCGHRVNSDRPLGAGA